jgi:hypothetical protein
MSNHRQRLDRATAERLLSGDPVAAPPGQESLAHLLAAAAAPGRHRELVGERAAMVAFRNAHRVPPTQQRSHSMIRSALAKILTAKAAAVVAATTIGGVAVAAGTGNLPTTHSHQQVTSQSQQEAETTETTEAGHTASKPARPETGSHANAAAPSPSMVGLCRAYAAGEKANHGKALDSPAFTALVTAAGDKAKVSGWCTTLLAQQKSTHPDPAGSPTQAPTASTEHPDGSQHSGASTGHRTGAPTSLPTPTGTPTPHAP